MVFSQVPEQVTRVSALGWNWLVALTAYGSIKVSVTNDSTFVCFKTEIRPYSALRFLLLDKFNRWIRRHPCARSRLRNSVHTCDTDDINDTDDTNGIPSMSIIVNGFSVTI